MRAHPATVLSVAACGWLLVIKENNVVVSAVVLAVAIVTARSWRVAGATAGLALPMVLSLVAIHGPHGSRHLWWIFTADGLVTAGALGIRLAALLACFLAAGALVSVTEVAKWLQVSPAGYKVAYVVGSALQFIPQGREAVETVRYANRLAGVRLNARTVGPRYVVPVVTRLVAQGVQRGKALEAVGFDRPGRRTVVRPVQRRWWDWWLPPVVLGVALWV